MNWQLILEFLKNERSVVPAETKCIAQGIIDNPFLRHVERKVQVIVYFRIIREVVNRRGNDIISEGEDCSNGFNGAGSSKQMARH